MAQLKLSPAWDIYYMQVKTLFADDDEVKVVYDRDSYTLNLYVDNDRKAEALTELMPEEMSWGNVTMGINVFPRNKLKTTKMSTKELFLAAFDGNPNLAFAESVSLLYSNPMTFVVFRPVIVQYYTDNMGDWNGFRSELYSDLPEEVFKEIPGVYYCTDKISQDLTSWL